MSPDKQKLMEDIHSSYHRLFGLAESMEMIDGVSLPLIDEAKQALIHMAGCLEDALAVSEEPRRDIIATRDYVEKAQEQYNRFRSQGLRNWFFEEGPR